MKAKTSLKNVLCVAAIILAGCATARVDWNARLGNYTFDQAVIELGPPDKQAKLSDGRTVADWITRRNGGTSVSVGTGFGHGYYGGYPGGVGVVQTYNYPDTYESKLRLTFNTNNVLADWARK
jgi:hypothetical protein